MTRMLDGQVAVVTGAGGGMGQSYARQLARLGAKVVVNDYGGDVLGRQDGSSAAAQRVVGEIEAEGGTAIANALAVGNGENARAIIAAATEAYSRIDILVNNAGTALPGAIDAFEDEAIERHYATNLIGGYHLVRAAWPIMKSQHYGRILNISSNDALVGGT